MTFATGLSAPEGPVALPDGTWLVVESGAERGCVTQVSSDGRNKRVVAKTGRPNGLAVDSEGMIWVAESNVPSLLRLTIDGKKEVVATECDGEPFLFPNDLCFGPDSALYFTDSGVYIQEFAPNNRIRADYLSVAYDGRVYRVDVQSGKITKIDGDLKFTNGVAFGPDNLLYVNETLTGNVYSYGSKEGCVAGPRVLFGNVIRPDASPGWKGPDGMAFGTDGRLYVAVFGQRDVTVLDAQGQVAERIPTQGTLPTNVAFGLAGQKRLYVTEFELGQIEVFEVACDGLTLWSGTRLRSDLQQQQSL